MLDVKFEKVHEDARGKIFEITIGDRHFSLITSNKGSLRGGHHHDKDELQVFLVGKIKIEMINPKTSKKVKRLTVTSGDTVFYKRGEVHLLTALTDAAFLEIKGEGYKNFDYEPMRKRVREWLEKQSS